MQLTQLLTQSIGTFMTIVGLIFLLRHKYFTQKFKQFFSNHPLRLTVASGELLAGLFLAIGYNEWATIPAIVLSVLGWAMTAEGILNLILKEQTIKRAYKQALTTKAFLTFSFLCTAVGVFLAGAGFGFW